MAASQSVPDDDPDFEWVNKTAEEAAAELAVKKARLARERGLSREEAIVDEHDLTIDALEPEDGVFAVPRDWEERLLREHGQAARDQWRKRRARAGKKRVPRASAPWYKKFPYCLRHLLRAVSQWLAWRTVFRRYVVFANKKNANG